MNVKQIARQMDKKKAYWWAMMANGSYELRSTGGNKIYSTADRYEAEAATKKLRGLKMNIVGGVPATKLID